MLSIENMFCNTVQAELTRKGVGQKFTEHISENQGFGTNRLARAQTVSSHSHHFDMTGFYRGKGRGFL